MSVKIGLRKIRAKLPGEEWHTLVRAFAYLHPYKPQVALVSLLSAISSLLVLAPTYLEKLIIDNAIGGANIPLLIWLTVVAVIVPLAAEALGVLSAFINERIGLRISQDARRDLLSRFQTFGFSFFDRHNSGDLMTRLTTDADAVRGIGIQIPIMVIENLVIVVTAFIVCFRYEPFWTTSIFLIYMAEYFPTQAGGERLRTRSQAIRDIDSHSTQVLHESLNGIKTLQLFRREGSYLATYRHLLYKKAQGIRSLSVFRKQVDMQNELFRAAGSMLAWTVIGLQVYSGRYTVGDLWLLTFYLRRMSTPFRVMTFDAYLGIKERLPYLSRFFEYLDTPSDVIDRQGACTINHLKGDIRFEAVSFDYPGSSERVLHDVSFAVQPGSIIALVGPSGAGKTTITKLLGRYYDVDNGRIIIDGHDIRDLSLQSLRRRIGTVFQDTYLFNATIRENLLLADPEASEQRLIDVVRAAQLHEFIKDLPDGFDTLVGERGIKLSGGQRQRLAIARLLLYNPDICIFDEATAALDSETEAAIHAVLDQYLAGRTRIIVAHRLSTVAHCDRILVVDDGRIVEDGTQTELLTAGGTYARLSHTWLTPSEGVQQV